MYAEANHGTALHAACHGGHLAVAHVLVQSGVAVDKMDTSLNTAVVVALVQGHNEIVKYLIRAGSSVSLKVEPLFADQPGRQFFFRQVLLKIVST